MLISLQDLIKETTQKELEQILGSYRCAYDYDIEYFLKEKAVTYEKLAKARTYLVFSEEEVTKSKIENLTVWGYIALALKVLVVPDSVSNSARKNLDGLSAKIHGEQINAFSVYLIGQLGRNSRVSKENVSGRDLLSYAYNVIQNSVNAVGGRFAMVECHNNSKLIDFYSQNGFSTIGKDQDMSMEMVQLIKKCC